ncbi:GlcG protein [Pokkaliibacter plantistimulans]|uniref:GlcG protein n=1 Tax=Pokkaliibacter plantistimulans TaxID=1635171 RepID=A0ABX5LUC9_9GAMM|nr:heme-binding protein [Pokkaliibacter plantistimulans]PXF29108.1 GlcG protein [Pokkaliibacter plantistimulans]
MSNVSLGQARVIVDNALQIAREQGFRPMAIMVVDSAGHSVLGLREDGASHLRVEIAAGKAGSSIGMGSNSRVLAKRAAEMPGFFSAIASTASQPFIPQTGAVLIVQGEEVIGAVGASGGTGDEDELIVVGGIAAAGLSYR